MSDVSAFLSARAAAELAGVDERTIRRWVKTGQLAAENAAAVSLSPVQIWSRSSDTADMRAGTSGQLRRSGHNRT